MDLQNLKIFQFMSSMECSCKSIFRAANFIAKFFPHWIHAFLLATTFIELIVTNFHFVIGLVFHFLFCFMFKSKLFFPWKRYLKKSKRYWFIDFSVSIFAFFTKAQTTLLIRLIILFLIIDINISLLILSIFSGIIIWEELCQKYWNVWR